MRKAVAMAGLAVMIAVALGGPAAHAVEPDEVLQDPALEARARAISANLRCLVCQNQSIDDSHAPLARDLRILVREELKQGKTDDEILDYVVARYGEFVLLKPRFVPHNYILWFATPILLALGIVLIVVSYRRSRAVAEPEAPLTAAEKRRLSRLLDQS
ncbi:cytochrome c-type biogenesis protein [Methyloligella sp. GL2]|uniref:cytochrome c-type biogenesis protein n=1 Tax=unclassified Methyloligella TaxID=2625955 RepID=UPI00352D0356